MKRNFIQIHAAIGLLFTVLSLASPAQTARQGQAEPPPKVIRKANDALQASAISRVEAVYPPLALTAHISGTVFVEVTIDESGQVASAHAFSGHPLLKDAAVEAARGWTFKPALLQGKPVKVVGTLRFIFNLPGYILRDPARIIERLQQQVARNPKNPMLHYRLARAYEDDRQFANALKAYSRAVELKPDYGEARVALGDLNMKLNQYAEALDAYNQAVLLDLPAEVKAASYGAMATIYFRRDQFRQAVELFKQAIALAPQGPTYLSLGLTYLKLGDKASAIEQYRLLKERNSILAERLLKQINEAR
ncbi:MAG TPA: TonB family protein [Blastocatellia bacterium]|nr:TonB family protein [Blastocatellia bacterium]